uniref:Uncharacterized protein AlNc14C74G5031 n=1 Tax=Albugo laibachii Nc14 TaxID=890382 RepID=F0WEH8_9STRA|nr:conserved hypothetical protein [Albugo laibachii Nc14]|eukprot:CCA19610.1 conserved hypothetical protein [Albugo laibachii Nc14]
MPESVPTAAVNTLTETSVRHQANVKWALNEKWSAISLLLLISICVVFGLNTGEFISSRPFWMMHISAILILTLASSIVYIVALSITIKGVHKHITDAKAQLLEAVGKWRLNTQNMTLPCSFTIPAMEGTQAIRTVEPSQKVVPRKSLVPDTIDTNVTDTGQTPDAIYFGTIIDVQGAHGSLIPHLIDQKKLGTLYPLKNDSSVDNSFPWIIPFVLATSELTLLDWETFTGKTVRFAILNGDNNEVKLVACNLRPVLSMAEVQEEISKSRSALLICNQARQESFAKAMEDIKMISPRHEPVIHHIDLIQYAAKLDSQGECLQ